MTAQQTNLDLVARARALIRTGFADPDDDLFADDVVFHFFNPSLPEFAGDHHGYDGFRRCFERLRQGSDAGFHNEPHALTPYGDEIVAPGDFTSLLQTMREVDLVETLATRGPTTFCRVKERDIPARTLSLPGSHGRDRVAAEHSLLSNRQQLRQTRSRAGHSRGGDSRPAVDLTLRVRSGEDRALPCPVHRIPATPDRKLPVADHAAGNVAACAQIWLSVHITRGPSGSARRSR